MPPEALPGGARGRVTVAAIIYVESETGAGNRRNIEGDRGTMGTRVGIQDELQIGLDLQGELDLGIDIDTLRVMPDEEDDIDRMARQLADADPRFLPRMVA